MPERNAGQGSAGHGAAIRRRAADRAAQASAARSPRAAATVPSSAPSRAKRRLSIPDLQGPAGAPAGRPASGDWKYRRNPAARKPAARKPGAARRPALPAPSSPSRGPVRPRRSVRAPSAANGSARTSAPSASRRASAAPAATCPQSELHDADGVRLQKVMASGRRGFTARLRGNDRRRPRRGRRPGGHRTRCARRPQDCRHPRGRPAHPAGRDPGLHGLQQAQGRRVHHGGPRRPSLHQRLRPQHTTANASSTSAAWTSPPRACCC